jgi:hypothetical protein
MEMKNSCVGTPHPRTSKSSGSTFSTLHGGIRRCRKPPLRYGWRRRASPPALAGRDEESRSDDAEGAAMSEDPLSATAGAVAGLPWLRRGRRKLGLRCSPEARYTPGSGIPPESALTLRCLTVLS